MEINPDIVIRVIASFGLEAEVMPDVKIPDAISI
jgi:hypothetical protein